MTIIPTSQSICSNGVILGFPLLLIIISKMAEILPSCIDAEFCMITTQLVNMPSIQTYTHALPITDTTLACTHTTHTWGTPSISGRAGGGGGGGGGGQDRVRGRHLTAKYNYGVCVCVSGIFLIMCNQRNVVPEQCLSKYILGVGVAQVVHMVLIHSNKLSGKYVYGIY